MAEIGIDMAVGQLVAVLREGFEGAAQWSYFTDHGAGSGLLGTVAKLSAEETSEPRGGSSIVAHAYHTSFALQASAAWIRGDRSRRNWQESWSVTTLDAEGWKQLQEELRKRYEDLRRAIEEEAATSLEAFGGATGAVAHVAYHLGAIRQKVLFSGRSSTRS